MTLKRDNHDIYLVTRKLATSNCVSNNWSRILSFVGTRPGHGTSIQTELSEKKFFKVYSHDMIRNTYLVSAPSS